VRLLVATHNEHKLRELSRMLPEHQLSKLDEATPLPPEDGETFEANALLKARAVAASTNEAALGEDSGIEAVALGGAPGVRSARYASVNGNNASDADNLAKLLREAPAGSGLRYVSVLAYVDPATGVERLFRGECSGRLAEAARGDRGFGYDPVFLPDDRPDGRTMAELEDSEKDLISHRGRAARELLDWLAEAA
jgi:XTP/dITP diphosphohydrolase